MAGIRQHVIPKFLLRQFSVERKKNRSYVQVITKGDAYESNIVNVSVQKYFYGEADNPITDRESEYAAIVHRLIEGVPPMEILQEVVELVSHLQARTWHIRKSIIDTGEALMMEIAETIQNDKKYMIRVVEEKIKREPELRKQRRASGRDYFLQRARLVEKAQQLLLDMFTQQATDIMDALCRGGEIGHNRALADNPSPTKIREKLLRLHWSVEHKPDIYLLLGDSVTISFEETEHLPKSFSFGDKALRACIVPLSSHHLLIGAQGYDWIDTHIANEWTAKCAMEYVVCETRPADYQEIQQSIGELSALLTEEQRKSLIDSVMKT